jgi:hypothetical protein
MNDIKINDDGSMVGMTFTEKYNGGKNVPYPHPKERETYRQYKERVDKLVQEQNFHKGDLSWGDWHNYCVGHGYMGDADAIVGEDTGYHEPEEDNEEINW